MTMGPGEGGLPDEQVVASYRDGQLRLTNLRVLYRGRWPSRHETFSAHVGDLSAVGLGRRYTVQPWLLVIPYGPLLAGIALSMQAGEADLVALGVAAAFSWVPVAVVGQWLLAPRYGLRIVVGGSTLLVGVPRSHIGEARDFIEEMAGAMAQHRDGAPGAPQVAPTASPFRL